MMDGLYLGRRLPPGSLGQLRMLSSEVVAKQSLLARIVAGINKYSGRENHYFDQLLRPHMDFMIHEFPVRIQAISKQVEREDALKAELKIM